eukprot:CAMPEP_0170809296 /NCGR_PEP_ID=MMETSP0733-20121128/33945_1 /TAXON_ID=186038 /ORGANISM="Fragilariopsis kerguelensis, Strain L26-C5" /LENGTH=261 /DNA_ID=CAMNT_0011164969 /DNA_START=83 /DNA_END=865 /DNA_ORIENTATION=+
MTSSSTSASSLLLPQKISSTSTSTSMKQKKKHPTNYKFVDIGANLLDERYTDGIYYGKKRHASDFEQVIQRSVEYGVTHLILTAGTLHECKEATQPSPPLFLGCTVGIHPTRCQQEFIDNLITDDDDDADDDDDGDSNSKCSDNKDHDQIQTTTTRTTTATDVLEELYVLAKDGVTDGCVVAIGEIGLDYDRLEFTSKKNNTSITEAETKVASLPLFLHNRSVGRDLLQILQQERQQRGGRGVVHSFDDTIELAFEFIDMG